MVFFGSSRFSIIVLDRLKELGIIPELIVTTPDKEVGRKKVLTPSPVKIWAQDNEVLFFDPIKLKDILTELDNFKNKPFLLASFGKILPKSLVELPKKGILNIHPSLLPKYRGPTPIQSAIISGEEITGVSIMVIDEEIDHGPILTKKSISILDKNYENLEKELGELGAKLISEFIEPWQKGEIEAKPQDHSLATFTKKFDIEDARIDEEVLTGKASKEKLVEASRKIRALNPEPGTWTIIKSKGKEMRLKITNASFTENTFKVKRVLPAGKKEMDWEAFLRGNPLD